MGDAAAGLLLSLIQPGTGILLILLPKGEKAGTPENAAASPALFRAVVLCVARPPAGGVPRSGCCLSRRGRAPLCGLPALGRRRLVSFLRSRPPSAAVALGRARLAPVRAFAGGAIRAYKNAGVVPVCDPVRFHRRGLRPAPTSRRCAKGPPCRANYTK